MQVLNVAALLLAFAMLTGASPKPTDDTCEGIFSLDPKVNHPSSNSRLNLTWPLLYFTCRCVRDCVGNVVRVTQALQGVDKTRVHSQVGACHSVVSPRPLTRFPVRSYKFNPLEGL